MIPKPLREQVGLGAGAAEIVVVGTGLRIEPISATHVAEENGHLVIPASGVKIDDELVQVLRRAGQK